MIVKRKSVWRERRTGERESRISVVLCVIVFCGTFPLRTHFYCNSAEQSALHGGGVPFHLVLAKTPTLNNCSHSEVGREALMRSVGKCDFALTLGSLPASVCVCVCDEGITLT